MASGAPPTIRQAHFVVTHTAPSDDDVSPMTAAAVGSSWGACASRELEGVAARNRKKDAGQNANGGTQGASAWAVKLYETADEADTPPERIAALFERAAQTLEPSEAEQTSPRANATLASGARRSSTSAAQPRDPQTVTSPPSMSIPSSELYKDLDDGADTACKTEHTEGTSAPEPTEEMSAPASTTNGGSGAVDAHSTSDDTAPQEHFTMANAPDRKIAWRCGVCDYFVLAMDQNGNPLPFAVSAFGHPLPLRCPRCQLEHTAWEQDVPFDSHGDHVNVRSKLSNNYVLAGDGRGGAAKGAGGGQKGNTGSGSPPSSALAAATARYEKTFQTNHTSLFRYNLLSSLSETHQGSSENGAGSSTSAAGAQQRLLRNTAPNHRANALSRLGLNVNAEGDFNLFSSLPRATPSHSMAYYCGLCNRRLLRVDAQGELVPMDCDEKGQVLPITCPGCGECHGNWAVKPFAARNAAPTGKRLY